MHGQKCVRTQVDGKQEEVSRANQLDCSDLPSVTRQEFADEVDVNKLLQRYGAGAGLSRPPIFGRTVDYDVDLQMSIEAINAAQVGYRRLPSELREEYKDWRAVLAAIQNGDLIVDMQTGKIAKKDVSPPGATSSGNSPAIEQKGPAKAGDPPVPPPTAAKS